MEKEARGKRILMRRIHQEQEALVYRLRAAGAQMCIVRCWRQYKRRKEDKVDRPLIHTSGFLLCDDVCSCKAMMLTG